MAYKGGRAPVQNTCPDIDRLIKRLKNIDGILRGWEKLEEPTDLKGVISDIESELWGFQSELEDLRSANAALRDWGHEEAERVDKLEEELERLREE